VAERHVIVVEHRQPDEIPDLHLLRKATAHDRLGRIVCGNALGGLRLRKRDFGALGWGKRSAGGLGAKRRRRQAEKHRNADNAKTFSCVHFRSSSPREQNHHGTAPRVFTSLHGNLTRTHTLTTGSLQAGD
jgi:hypothetical protein